MKNATVLTALILLFFACGDDTTMDPPADNNKLPTEFKALFNIFDGDGIGAATNLNDDIMLFISTSGMEYAWFEDNEIKRTGNISDEDGLFDGLSFAAVSGMVDYSEERLAFFDMNSGSYQWAILNPDRVAGNSSSDSTFTFQESFGLWQWGTDNTFPFEKVGASFGFSKEAEGCATTEDDDLYMWMVDASGEEVVRYIKGGNGVFEETIELEEWRSNSVCGGSPAIFPLGGIGAACVYDPDGGIYRELYFSTDGSQMTILTPSQGSYSEIYDLR